MYNFERKHYYSNYKTVGRKATGTIVYMCPHCYNLEYFDGEVGVVLKPKRRLNNDDVYEYLLPNITISYTCPKCKKHDDQIFMDPNIAPAISILNKKGWITDYCCEGHEETTYRTKDKVVENKNSYILFDSAVYYALKKILKKYPLPRTWYVDKKNMDEEDKRIPIRSKNYKDTKIEDIVIWAGMLPKNKQRMYGLSNLLADSDFAKHYTGTVYKLQETSVSDTISKLDAVIKMHIGHFVNLNIYSIIKYYVLEVAELYIDKITDTNDKTRMCDNILIAKSENSVVLFTMNILFDLLYKYDLCKWHVNYICDSATGCFLKLIMKEKSDNLPNADMANLEASKSIQNQQFAILQKLNSLIIYNINKTITDNEFKYVYETFKTLMSDIDINGNIMIAVQDKTIINTTLNICASPNISHINTLFELFYKYNFICKHVEFIIDEVNMFKLIERETKE